MSSEKLIHVKLEYPEALQAKKELLLIESSFLRINKKIQTYQSFRLEELKLKDKLKKKINQTTTNLGKLIKTIPKIQIPEILKEHSEENEEFKRKLQNLKSSKEHENLEAELLEIQRKLADLGQ